MRARHLYIAIAGAGRCRRHRFVDLAAASLQHLARFFLQSQPDRQLRHRQPQRLLENRSRSRRTHRDPRLSLDSRPRYHLSGYSADADGLAVHLGARLRLRALPHLHRRLRSGGLVHNVPHFAGTDLRHRGAIGDIEVPLGSRALSRCAKSPDSCKLLRGLPCRDGGTGRHAALRMLCPKGVQVQVLFPAPSLLLFGDGLNVYSG